MGLLRKVLALLNALAMKDNLPMSDNNCLFVQTFSYNHCLSSIAMSLM